MVYKTKSAVMICLAFLSMMPLAYAQDASPQDPAPAVQSADAPSSPAPAADQPPSDQATAAPPTYEVAPAAQELVGDWQMVYVPDSIQPRAVRVNQWPAQCQWFSFAANGMVKSLDHARAPCEFMTGTNLERMVAPFPVVAIWRYDTRAVPGKTFMEMQSSEMVYAEYWEAHVVTQDFLRDGADFKAGDLLLYLTNMRTHQITWIRHLRRLPQ